tara:strand:- start:204 stop:779 length:576 start_codon:yes stop_codon:yes gene_type:complete
VEKKIDFYFDVVSPYSYLASKLIGEIVKKNNAILNWKPILLGGIFKAIGRPIAPGLVPEKKPYLIKDLERLSNYYGIPFKMPLEFPTSSLLAMRVLCGLKVNNIHFYAEEIFEAYWKDNKNIADIEVLSEIVNSESVEKANTQEIKDKLFKNTEAATKRGIFGVPSFFIGDEMFFGHDRISLLDNYLQTKF